MNSIFNSSIGAKLDIVLYRTTHKTSKRTSNGVKTPEFVKNLQKKNILSEP